jgi:hypothetical protein
MRESKAAKRAQAFVALDEAVDITNTVIRLYDAGK